MTKPKTSAADWRIKPDQYNSWAVCKPRFRKDGERRFDKDGNPYYEAFRWYTSLALALEAWFEMLMADECDDKANDVRDLIEALGHVKERFVTSRVSADANGHSAIYQPPCIGSNRGRRRRGRRRTIDIETPANENGMTEEHDTSGELTCPNCGTSSEDHAVVMATDDMGSCNACGSVWNESDKAVKRIRALESDLQAARERERELEQDARISHAHLDGLMDLLGVDDTDKAHTEIGRLQVDLKAALEEIDVRRACYSA